MVAVVAKLAVALCIAAALGMPVVAAHLVELTQNQAVAAVECESVIARDVFGTPYEEIACTPAGMFASAD